MSCDWFVTKWFFVYQVLTTRKAVMQSTLKGTLERGQCCWALRNWTPCHQDYCTWTHCTSTGEVMGRVRRHLPASWFMSVFSTLHPLWWTSAWNTTILHCVCSFPKISQRSLLQMSLPLIFYFAFPGPQPTYQGIHHYPDSMYIISGGHFTLLQSIHPRVLFTGLLNAAAVCS